jgi:oligopeptide/dipeptide ABC transporter ATP-binding protein
VNDVRAPVLELRDLTVHIRTRGGIVQPVRGVSLQVAGGETLALVGESGCGKSMTALAATGLLPAGAAVVNGTIRLQGETLNALDERGWNRVRGARIGMVFQNPMSSFNPTMRVGEQIAEGLIAHRGLGRGEALGRAAQLLERMRIPAARRRARQYPGEFSGGMLQRAMIAMAVACEPALLIADEPTTALDVTVQREVLNLLRELQRERDMALLLITHDLGVVAQVADRVAVMYAGQIIEHAPVDAIFFATAHPYTAGLKQALPERHRRGEGLQMIKGTPPDLMQPPPGCGFYPRCERALRICAEGEVPEFTPAPAHGSRCWLLHPQIAAPIEPHSETPIETRGDD